MTVLFNDTVLYDKELISCPLCGSSSIKGLYIIRRYSPSFKVDRCARCGFIFMNPRFSNTVIHDLYREDYYRGNADYRYYDERETEKFARYVWKGRVNVISRFIDGGDLLDIGCAFGGLLSEARRWFTPYGIEMSEYAGAHARTIYGEKIHVGTLENHPFRHNKFSVITMIEVLEHTADPVHAVEECYRLLDDGGLLVIQTANMEGMQARLLKDHYAYFMPGHLSYFSKSNLTDLFLRTGFRKIKAYHPVEFGLLPKLLKSRGNFTSLLDYRHWMRIALYHYASKLRAGSWAATSSLVLYAFK